MSTCADVRRFTGRPAVHAQPCTCTAVYDESVWSFEPGDPNVGIFGETWVHEACELEYEQGCQIESRLEGRKVRNGMLFADEHFTLTCLDCGTTTSFTDETLMGFEGEQGV